MTGSPHEGGERPPTEEVDAPGWARLLLVAAPFLLAVAVLLLLGLLLG